MLIQNLDNEAIKIIGKFKNGLRKKMYKEIEKEINKDTFKIIFEKEKNIAIEETRQQLEEGMKEISKGFEEAIKEIVSKDERYTVEMLQSFYDSAKFDFEFEPTLNIKSRGSFVGEISSLGLGARSIILSVGWVVTVLVVVEMLISVSKNILGFFDDEYRVSQQKKATDENIEKMATQLSESIRENIKKAHDPLTEGIEKVKENLSLKIKYVNNMNQVFQEAERKLKLLSWEIDQEGMGKPNGNN